MSNIHVGEPHVRRLPPTQESRFIDKLVEFLAQELRDRTEEEAAATAGQFESPIEHAFFLAWTTLNRVNKTFVDEFRSQLTVTAGDQVYRLDFALVADNPRVRVAIELDGHDFHERTPEQVEARNQRDADLLNAGWVVLHFSGRQILQHPFDCLDLVIETAITQAYPMRRKRDALDSH